MSGPEARAALLHVMACRDIFIIMALRRFHFYRSRYGVRMKSKNRGQKREQDQVSYQPTFISQSQNVLNFEPTYGIKSSAVV